MSKSIKCSVVHAALYLMVGGSLEHQPKGTVITISDDNAERLKGKVSPVKDKDAVEVGTSAEAAKAEAAKKA